MANPWESDPIVQPAQDARLASNPWDQDEVVDDGPGLDIDIVGGMSESQAREQILREMNLLPEQRSSRFERVMAGIGKSLVDTGQGLAQGVTNAVLPNQALLEQGAAVYPQSNMLAFLAAIRPQQQQQVERRRASDPSFSEDPVFGTGNIAGTLAQLLGPGIAARGSSLGSALLPTTIRGNALQGGVIGGVQPVASEAERGVNVGLGSLAGAVGSAIPKAAGAIASPLRALLGQQTLSGAERGAGRTLLQEASDPATILRAQPSAVPGVVRTLGEETMDPGIAGLERMLRGRQPGQFAPIDLSNNAARTSVLEGIAGNDADMVVAEAARDSATASLRDTAMQEGRDYSRMSGLMQDLERARLMLQAQDVQALNSANVPMRAVGGAAPFPVMTQREIEQQVAGVSRTNLSPLVDKLRSVSSSNAGNPAVQSTLERVDTALSDARNTVPGLYNVRKYIDALLSGKAGSDTTAARAASAELMAMKSAIDEELVSRAPTFSGYLRAYRSLSQPINRMEVGRELMRRGSGAVPDAQGNNPILPASFLRASEDLDGLAARATGFQKARAADILSKEDVSAIKAIQDDMQRISVRNTSSTVGSPTDAYQQFGRRTARNMLQSTPVVGRFAELLDQQANQRLQERLAYLVANPAEARRVVSALNKQDRAVVNKALLQLIARPAAATPALTE